MASIVDERGFNQCYKPSRALEIRTDRRASAIMAEMGGTREPRILEVGCGTGELAHLLATKTKGSVVAGDLSTAFIETARKSYSLPNLRFEKVDFGRDLEVERFGGKFDFIVGNGILHHLYHQLGEVLPIWGRSLRRGGKLIFWEPNLWNPYVFLLFQVPLFRTWGRLEPTEMAFTMNFIRGKLEGAGYSQVKVECRDFLLPNVPDPLIDFVVGTGAVLERIPVVNKMAQSLFLTATWPA